MEATEKPTISTAPIAIGAVGNRRFSVEPSPS